MALIIKINLIPPHNEILHYLQTWYAYGYQTQLVSHIPFCEVAFQLSSAHYYEHIFLCTP
jgi:hypothetical protein